MSNKAKLSFGVIIVAILISLVAVLPATATSENDIVYPVAELGGCIDETDCRIHCDNPDNFAACFAFARGHNLLRGSLADKTEDDIRRFAETVSVQGGPGGCSGHDECETYCNNVANINECVNFAEKHNIMSPDELDEAKIIRDFLAGGGELPGGKTNKDDVEDYCFGSGGVDFGDFVPERLEECIAFGVEAGFMTAEEAEMIRRTGGKGPGGCRGRQCETYCDDPAHDKECFAFAVDAGFISPEEAIFVKKVQEKTGCRGRHECEKFFEGENEELFNEIVREVQAENPGFDPRSLIPEGELANIKEDIRRQIGHEFDNMPPEIAVCARSKVDELLNTPDFSPFDMREKMEKAMQECFGSSGFPGGPGGPGGPRGEVSPEFANCMREAAGNEDRMNVCFTEFGPPGVGPGFPGRPGEFPGGQFEGSPVHGTGFPERGDFSGSSLPNLEACIEEKSFECDRQFTGKAGQDRCKEAVKKECEVGGVPPEAFPSASFESFPIRAGEFPEGFMPPEGLESFPTEFPEGFIPSLQEFEGVQAFEFEGEKHEEFIEDAPVEEPIHEEEFKSNSLIFDLFLGLIGFLR